ncbi:MAG: hypothetical protein V4772_07345 [Pseudomonadota bacterium]
MTSFVHLDYSTQHPGVARIESAIDATQQLRKGFSATRSIATLLLSAIAAAVMVVAYQVMDSVAEGHLLVMWIALWAAAFVALAVFASTARHMAVSLKTSLDDWSRSIAEARADQRLWALAKADARVMADLQAARTRDDYGFDEQATVAKAEALPVVAEPKVKVGSGVMRAYQRNYI